MRLAAWLWIAAALILASLELATLTLFCLMVAGGALAAAVAAALGAGFPMQLLVAALGSVAMIGVVRPVALRHMRKQDPEARTGIDALIGQQALVLSTVDGHDGRVKLAGEVWSARSYDPSLVIEAGSTVDVLAIEGATAVVHATHL